MMKKVTMMKLLLILSMLIVPYSGQTDGENEIAAFLPPPDVLLNDDSVSAILDYIKIQDKNLVLATQSDVVLVLGITGSGKSTLTLLLTGAELEAKEIDGAEGSFLIVDKNNKISGTSTTTSKTIVPDLMIEEMNGTAFYDCPGFGDSRGAKIDIAATFAIRKLLNFAESFKFIFTASYNSMQVAIGDRLDFMELTRYATNIVMQLHWL